VLSGQVLILLKPFNTLIALSMMLLIGAVFISLVKTKDKVIIKKDSQRANLMIDVKNTLSLMKKTRAIFRSLFLLALSQILVLIIATVAPGYAQDIVKIPIEDFPLLFAAPAAFGMVVGAFILIKFFHSHPKDRVIAAGIFLSGIAMLLLPYGSQVASRGFVQSLNGLLPGILQINILHIMVLLATILGIANAFVFVTANTILQEKTTDDVRGKMYGFLNSVVGILSLIPIIVAGGLSDLIGVGIVITGLGVCLLLLGSVWFHKSR
jgi:MFS family permease